MLKYKTHYETSEIFDYMICKNHADKMQGMTSLSTSVLLNENCQRRRHSELKCQDGAEMICKKCFADNLFNVRKSMQFKYAFNHTVLTHRLFTVDEMPLLNCLVFRLEAFGDLANIIQAENYLRLCKKNPDVHFALWTKNPWILYNAINVYENGKKPKNLKVVYSSPFINKPQTSALNVYKLRNGKPMIDKVFTVYTCDYAIENNVKINCGNKKCLGCKLCYMNSSVKEINEIVKNEQPRYYRLIEKK